MRLVLGLAFICVSSGASAQPVGDDQVQRVAEACRFYPAFVQETITHFIGKRTEKDAIAELEKTKKAIEEYIKAHGASFSEQRRLREHDERIQLLRCMVDRKLTVASLRSGRSQSAPVAKDGWVDAGGGCKVAASPQEGRIRWVGPCEDGFAHGEGYLVHDAKQGKERSIGKMTMERGSSFVRPGESSHTLYVLYEGTIRKIVADGKQQESLQVAPADLPAYARAFLMEGKLPARPRQPEEAAAASSAPLATGTGDCDLNLTPEQKQMYRPKGDEVLVWVGPCANGLAHGRGVVFQRRKDPGNGVTYRYAVRYFAREGLLEHSFRPVYIGEASGVVWIDAEGAKETARVKRAEVPAWASFVLGKGNPSSKEIEAARQLLAQELQERAPKPEEVIEAGGCKLVFKPSPQTREYRWRGPCDASGFAHGPGYIEIYRANGGRGINKVSVVMGRMLRGVEPYEITPQRQIMHLSGNQWYPVVTDQAPAWAREFLLGATFAEHTAALERERQQARAQEEARAREQAREEEEARADLERIRRENEEDDRRARREARAEREARDRQWTDMATSIMQGAAAMKRQQDEQNARREAQRRQIEADNARYRQQRADEDRRWLEQNQRQQQAALQQQQAAVERQRVEQQRREEEQRRRPREQRVNLPKYTGCIRLEWGKNIPQNVDQWYTLHNTCAQDLNVHWCDRPGCQRSGSMALIRGGGNTRSWLLKKNGVSVTVVAACQPDNGGKTVFLDRDDNQCWSMVTMN